MLWKGQDIKTTLGETAVLKQDDWMTPSIVHNTEIWSLDNMGSKMLRHSHFSESIMSEELKDKYYFNQFSLQTHCDAQSKPWWV